MLKFPNKATASPLDLLFIRAFVIKLSNFNITKKILSLYEEEVNKYTNQNFSMLILIL